MSSSPAVSVVIPVLNGAATIGDTLTGLTHQAIGLCAEEILVVGEVEISAFWIGA